MGKDKWNCNNGNHKKIFDYYKGIGHNTSYWELVMEKWDKLHLPKWFNEDCYNVIEVFHGDRNINAPIHLKDLQIESDGIYVQHKWEEENHFPTKLNRSLMCQEALQFN